jgi:archaellum component FlaC
MPNPIGRKRIPSASSEVDALKKELEALKSMYVQDMANISADIQTLGSQTQTSEPAPEG